jgi:hypothetical protein
VTFPSESQKPEVSDSFTDGFFILLSFHTWDSTGTKAPKPKELSSPQGFSQDALPLNN